MAGLLRLRLERVHVLTNVIVGARPDGTKEVIAIEDGYRESTESWATVLRDLKRRGMQAPVLAVGDGALGFWAAVRDVWPERGTSSAGCTRSPTCSTSSQRAFSRAPNARCTR